MSNVPDFMLAALPAVRRAEAPPPAPQSDDEPPPADVARADAPAPAREPPPFDEGIFPGMPAADYFAIEAMSQSGAKEIRRSPMHYRFARDNPTAPTDAMRLGTAIHDGVLEPDKFAERVVAMPVLNARTRAGRAMRDAFLAANAGRVVLSADDFDRARRCIDAVMRHPAAIAMLTGAQIETAFFWVDAEFRVPCKGRTDISNHGGMADLKTTTDASAEEYSRTIANYAYHAQAAHYFSGAEHLEHKTPDFFVHLVVETEPPHGVAAYEIPGNAIKTGAELMREALRRYRDSLASGFWPGYPRTIQRITLPRWATRSDTY